MLVYFCFFFHSSFSSSSSSYSSLFSLLPSLFSSLETCSSSLLRTVHRLSSQWGCCVPSLWRGLQAWPRQVLHWASSRRPAQETLSNWGILQRHSLSFWKKENNCSQLWGFSRWFTLPKPGRTSQHLRKSVFLLEHWWHRRLHLVQLQHLAYFTAVQYVASPPKVFFIFIFIFLFFYFFIFYVIFSLFFFFSKFFILVETST